MSSLLLAQKIDTLLHLADSALIISQRQSEWCGHGPVLEQDIAITNISLDLLGQARNFYAYAAVLINEHKIQVPSHWLNNKCVATEDSLAYMRTDREFYNCNICELPNGDWAQTILKLYFFSQYQQLLFAELQYSNDEQIAAIAAKSSKETSYHVRWSSDWVIRLGDGTLESQDRMRKAINELWTYVREFFELTDYEQESVAQKYYTDTAQLKAKWLSLVSETFSTATLPIQIDTTTGWTGLNGKKGIHTENIGFILAEMQQLQRTYPNAEW